MNENGNSPANPAFARAPLRLALSSFQRSETVARENWRPHSVASDTPFAGVAGTGAFRTASRVDAWYPRFFRSAYRAQSREPVQWRAVETPPALATRAFGPVVEDSRDEWTAPSRTNSAFRPVESPSESRFVERVEASASPIGRRDLTPDTRDEIRATISDLYSNGSRSSPEQPPAHRPSNDQRSEPNREDPRSIGLPRSIKSEPERNVDLDAVEQSSVYEWPAIPPLAYPRLRNAADQAGNAGVIHQGYESSAHADPESARIVRRQDQPHSELARTEPPSGDLLERFIESVSMPVPVPGLKIRLMPPNAGYSSASDVPATPAPRPPAEPASNESTRPPSAAPPPVDIAAIAERVAETLARRQQFDRERKGLY